MSQKQFDNFLLQTNFLVTLLQEYQYHLNAKTLDFETQDANSFRSNQFLNEELQLSVPNFENFDQSQNQDDNNSKSSIFYESSQNIKDQKNSFGFNSFNDSVELPLIEQQQRPTALPKSEKEKILEKNEQLTSQAVEKCLKLLALGFELKNDLKINKLFKNFEQFNENLLSQHSNLQKITVSKKAQNMSKKK